MKNSNQSKANRIAWAIIGKTGCTWKIAINTAWDQVKSPHAEGQLFLISFFKKSDGSETSRIGAFKDYPRTKGHNAQTFWSASDRGCRRYIPDLLINIQPIGMATSLAA